MSKAKADIPVCVYATSSNKNDLDARAKRLHKFCISQGWRIKKTIKAILPKNVKDQRTKLECLIKLVDDYDYIVVEHKDSPCALLTTARSL